MSHLRWLRRARTRALGILVVVPVLAMLAVTASAHGGDPTLIHACVKNAAPNKGTVKIVSPSTICPAGYTNTDWAIQGPPGPTQELILIQRNEFDTTEAYLDTTVDWETIVSGGAGLTFDPTNSLINMDTESSPYTAGSVVVRGRRTASVNGGTLVFKTRILDAYAEESGSVYGDRQPRGLVDGTDRDNAIEFVNAPSVGATHVACRTVSGGTVTETEVDIGQWVRRPAVYEIVAKPTEAKFYVNGALVCTHTTNIPTTLLNIYFSTSDGGAGNVPVQIDWVSFERRAG
jgi:hypothetical protein